MKICDVLENTTKRLKEAGAESPRLDAQLLLCRFLKKDKLYLLINKDKDIITDNSFEVMVREREQLKPMQYILKEAEFYGIALYVDENVLIPRADTEALAEQVINYIGDKAYSFLEIGTGSGCIPIAILKNCPNARGVSVDISADALKVAEKNANISGVAHRLALVNMDILNKFPKEKVNCIVSNPPYIEEEVIPTLMRDVKEYEPYNALCGGADGLDFYRRITGEGYKILTDGGLLAYEIGYNQGEAVKEILEQHHFKNIKVLKDLSGNNRVVLGIKK